MEAVAQGHHGDVDRSITNPYTMLLTVPRSRSRRPVEPWKSLVEYRRWEGEFERNLEGDEAFFDREWNPYDA